MFAWSTFGSTFGFDRFAHRVASFEPRTLSWALDVEAAATLREAWLSPFDLAPIVPRANAGDDVVVLIHGFMATAGVFRPMRARLGREPGVHVASFTHAPGYGVVRIAEQLSDLLTKIHPLARVHLVGHSLGGVVARWYVQEMARRSGAARITQTVSLGSPFGGVGMARRLPLLVGADLHGESDVLARVRARAHQGGVPHTSIIGGADRLVSPAASARFPVGDAIVLQGRGHNTLLFDEEVFEIIVRRVVGSRREAA